MIGVSSNTLSLTQKIIKMLGRLWPLDQEYAKNLSYKEMISFHLDG